MRVLASALIVVLGFWVALIGAIVVEEYGDRGPKAARAPVPLRAHLGTLAGMEAALAMSGSLVLAMAQNRPAVSTARRNGEKTIG